MKFKRQKRRENSATITQTLCLMVACSGLVALTAVAAPPAWWASRHAVLAPQVTTNAGVVTTSYEELLEKGYVGSTIFSTENVVEFYLRQKPLVFGPSLKSFNKKDASKRTRGQASFLERGRQQG